MTLTEYKQILLNTASYTYPAYLQFKLLKYIAQDERIVNDRRKTKRGQGHLLTINLTEIDGVENKLFHLLNHDEDELYAKLYKYVEEFEFVKGFRHTCIFEYEADFTLDMIENYKEAQIKIFNQADNSYDSIGRIDGTTTPTVKVLENKILFKYSYLLVDREGTKIKYIMLIVMDLESKLVSFYFDKVPYEFRNPARDFYAVMIDKTKDSFEHLTQIKLKCIDFKAIINYMHNEVNVEEDIQVYAQKMKRDGTTSYLEAKKDEEDELTIPILGELKNLLRSMDSLFIMNKETKEIKEILYEFVEEIELTSDYPTMKIRFKDVGFCLEMIHSYRDRDYSLFKIDGNISDDKEMIEYATECFARYYEELKTRT